MANETTYDVYTFARGRWILDTRFKKHQRERAIDEGKQFEKQPGIESVKVVREIYDQSDSLISERIVYKTQGDAIGSAGAGGGGGGGGGGSGGAAAGGGSSWFDEEDDDEAPSGGGRFSKKKKAKCEGGSKGASAGVLKRPEAMLVYKMIMIGVVSFAFAAFTTFIYATSFS